jgi:PST family polysaccharide transporter
VKRLSALHRHLERPAVQRVLRNTSWHVADRLLRMGVGFLVGVWVARYLGPDRFGELSYALALAGLLGSAATLGTDSVVVRDLVQEPDGEPELMATALVLRAAGAVASFLLVAVVAMVLPAARTSVRLLVVLAGAALLFKPIDLVDLWFQSRTDSGPPIAARGAAFLLVVALKVALILGGASVVAFGACEPITAALSAAFMAYVFRRRGRRVHWSHASWPVAKRLLGASWPLLISGVAILVYMRIDQVMLESMLGPQGSSAVGLYSVALRLSEVWYFVPMAITASVFPKLLEARRASEDLYRSRLFRLFSLMSALALAVAVPMTFLSSTVIRVVFGSRYAGAGPILAVHIWTTIFVFWGVVAESWYLAEGLTRLSLYRTTVAAVLNVCLNLVLIPRYGGVGAATATLVAMGISAWASNLLTARTRPLFWMQLRSLTLRGLAP